jgi:hypothetical protein
MQQQTWLLDYPAPACLAISVRLNDASALQQKHIDVLPSLVVVKMGARETRREVDVLENLAWYCEATASLYVGHKVLQAQLSGEEESTWACLKPVFGPSVQELGRACGDIPGWFVAHILLGMLDALRFVQDGAIGHKRVSSESFVLNLYPTNLHHRYRGYPDVQLIDFGAAGPLEEGDDAREVLRVMEEVIRRWSDLSPYVRFVEGNYETDDPLALILKETRRLSRSTELLDLDGVRAHLEARLIDCRHNGPEYLPRYLVKLLHSDLATDAEFEHALQ